MKPIGALLLLLAAAALGACGGESKETKAQNQVCDARADISKQVNTLKGLTPSAVNVSQVKTSLKAIRDDLGKITSAQGDLSGARKSQVSSANQEFKSKVQDVASNLGRSLSIGEAKTQLSAAFDDLAATYRRTFAMVDCSS
jgi:uncharacterized protein YjbJ (UPF0337 family)